MLSVWFQNLPAALVSVSTKKFYSTMSERNLRNFAENGKKILGAALNYMDIVKARGVPVPPQPLVFLKPTTSYLKEGQNIVLPRVFKEVNHEVELGVIIGKKCKNVSKDEAMSYVGGYCLALDLTAMCNLNESRSKGAPWTFGKGFDTSTPVSRFIELSEVKDPHNLHLWLNVNGEKRHDGNTKDLIFDVPYLISYLSQHMTLEPNDLILTGTPGGAAAMKHGDVLECGMGDLVTMKFNIVGEQ